MKSKDTALYILLTYVIMQLSPLLVAKPIFSILNLFYPNSTKATLIDLTNGWTLFITFFLGLLVTLLFILRDKKFFQNVFSTHKNKKKASIPIAILWGLLGFVLLLFGQVLAGVIEQNVFGIKTGSDNTAILTSIAATAPIIIIAIVFIGPFLEELIFRRIIFSTLYKKMNFFLAALISAVAFALIHLEFEHFLIYATTGLILAFLYQKTQRLLTSVIAHTLLNGYVTLISLNYDAILKYLESLPK